MFGLRFGMSAALCSLPARDYVISAEFLPKLFGSGAYLAEGTDVFEP
jgi:hypothetical protein